jgi:16S rRNA processing protein RimM
VTQAFGPGPERQNDERRIVLGKIAGVHGLAGWLKLVSYTDPREEIFGYRPLLVAGRTFEELEGKVQGKGLLIRLPGVVDRTAAEPLVGSKVEVLRSQLAELPPGEHYWSDLEGLTVVNREGKTLGLVERMMPTGANEVLVVRGEESILIPWVRGTYILDVDLQAGRIDVDWDPDWI